MNFLEDLLGGGSSQQVRFAPGCTNDQKQVFHMLKPHPAILMDRPRKLIRHGVLTYYSPNTNSTKPRYFFLFNDALLITKRKSSSKYRLRVFVHLRSNIRLYDLKNAREFRLVVPTHKGNRSVIMFAQNAEHKRAWVRDLMHCLWVRGGRIGPDPSGITPYTGPHLSPEEIERLRAEQLRRDEAEMRTMGNFFGDSDDESSGGPPSRSNPPADMRRKAAPSGGPDPYGASAASRAAFDPFTVKGKDAAPSTSASNAAQAYGVSGKPSAPQGASSASAYDFFGGADGGGSGDHAFDPFATSATASSTAGGASATDGSQDLLGLNDFDPFSAATAEDASIDWGTDPLLGGYASAGLDGGSLEGVGLGSAQAGAGDAYDANRLLSAGQGTADAMKGLFSTSSADAEALALQQKIEREAEQALREATQAIEEIAKRLAARPRRAPMPTEAPVTMDEVSDALMDGAEAVARAATVLLQASAQAQLERIQMGAQGLGGVDGKYHADPQWSNGLISAARQVVATTKYMVQCADDVAAGRAEYESLTASVHAVTASTTQLITAQRAKSDPNSAASRSLDAAAKGITKATRALVDQVNDIAAQQRAAANPPLKKDDYALSMDQVREIQAQAKALKLEEDARRAREELAELRKQKYQH